MHSKHPRNVKRGVARQRTAAFTTKPSSSKNRVVKGASTWVKIFSDELAGAGKKFAPIRKIESGLNVAAVDQIATQLKLPTMAVRTLAKISPSTFSRRQKTGVLSPEESDRIYRLQSIIAKATDFFEGNQAAACKWLNTPAPALNGVRPISMLINDAGVREVELLLGRLEYGVFT